jgi:hypothetical protein
MTPLSPRQAFRRLFISFALCVWASVPGAAATLSSFASVSTNTQPITDLTGDNSAATVSDLVNLSTAQTDFGANHAYANAVTGLGGDASSQWALMFTLTGGQPGAFAQVIIDYRYDAALTPANSNFNLTFEWGIEGNFPNQGTTNEVLDVKIYSNAVGNLEQCPGVPGPGGVPAAKPGQCAGSYDVPNGQIKVNDDFFFGLNKIGGNLEVGAANGTVDAFNTGQIKDIILPTGVTWTYETGVTGNPLNFQNAGSTSGAPEPGTWGLLAVGLAGGLLRLRRARNR